MFADDAAVAAHITTSIFDGSLCNVKTVTDQTINNTMTNGLDP